MNVPVKIRSLATLAFYCETCKRLSGLQETVRFYNAIILKGAHQIIRIKIV
jgi:hypothetical protein